MIVAGIDYSMTGPSIAIRDTKKPEDTQYFFMSNKKSLENSWGSIHGFKMPLYDSEQQRFDLLSDWAISVLVKFGVEKVCLEGYSMGSKGLVFNIGENTGLLKHKMWERGIEFIVPSPTQVKKFYTGKGNAKKDAMVEEFTNRTGIDFVTLMEAKDPTKSPYNDIADSHAMLEYGLFSFC